jgi:stearoyl-CoA desaturase (delta-9 desaturase)
MPPVVTDPSPASVPKEMLAGKRQLVGHVGVYVFIIVPFLALIAVVPVAWGWGLGTVDVALLVVFYTLTCLGVTVG